MHDKPHPQFGFAQTILPWIVAGGALIIYAVTLNHWVTLESLPYVAKVTGWDWVLPLHAPLFFLLTFPIRWIPADWQPIALNLFAATCAASSLGLLARSVALLPHDRTHTQRQRERSEFSLLSASSAWLPPVFAALVCGLQLTFWEHSVAATAESLNLLVFAYVIRCLLEYRIDPRERWLARMAFVYGLGVANNWAMIGFFPCFLAALVWIKGSSFFQFRFIARMIGYGAVGLSLYLLLPIAWAMLDPSTIDFGQALRKELADQKAFLLNPAPRSRIVLLSLTSLLPVLIMGIRWPSSFGDTSAAGAVVTNLMFRVVHVVFLGVCLWTAFDQQFSPRTLITTKSVVSLPLLTFYYLSALSVGYFSGYVLLVFSEGKEKPWKHHGPSSPLVNLAFRAAVWLALVAVPAGLFYKNFTVVWENRGEMLQQFAALCAAHLPPQKTIVLSDDPYSLMLLQARLSRDASRDEHVLVHTGSLPSPIYQRQLLKRYPLRWPNLLEDEPQGDAIEDRDVMTALMGLSRTNEIYYLNPSFGFYFEGFYARPRGLVYRLQTYATNEITSPPITAADFTTNQAFWSKLSPSLQHVQELSRRDSRDAQYLGMYYSRALNDWGVSVQRTQHLDDAGRLFELASNLNTNNKPARVNLEFNRRLRGVRSPASDLPKASDDKLGIYRDWETLLALNGEFDEPDYCFQLGEVFLQRQLFRQAAIQFSRAQTLTPTNVLAGLGLANAFLQVKMTDQALRQVAQIRAATNLPPLSPETDLALSRFEASAYFAQTNYATAEQILLSAQKKYPDRLSTLEALDRFYAHSHQTNKALGMIDKLLEKDPGYVSALIDQTTIHFNNRDFPRALGSLDRILQRDPKNLSALLYRVLVFIETKDYNKALTEVDRVLDIESNNYEALLHKGVILIEKQAYDEAIKPLTRLLKLQPNDWNALRNRAIANLQRGRLDDAQSDYEKLQRQLPHYHVPYYGLGEIAYRRKDTAAAIRNYEYYLRYARDEQGAELSAEKKMVSDRLKELRAAGR